MEELVWVIDKIVKNIVTRFPGAGKAAQVQSGYIIQMALCSKGGPYVRCTGVGGGAGKGQDKEKNKNSSSYLIERTVWGQRQEFDHWHEWKILNEVKMVKEDM